MASKLKPRVQVEIQDTLPDGTRYGLGLVRRDGVLLVRDLRNGGWYQVRSGLCLCDALAVLDRATTWPEALEGLVPQEYP